MLAKSFCKLLTFLVAATVSSSALALPLREEDSTQSFVCYEPVELTQEIRSNLRRAVGDKEGDVLKILGQWAKPGTPLLQLDVGQVVRMSVNDWQGGQHVLELDSLTGKRHDLWILSAQARKRLSELERKSSGAKIYVPDLATRLDEETIRDTLSRKLDLMGDSGSAHFSKNLEAQVRMYRFGSPKIYGWNQLDTHVPALSQFRSLLIAPFLAFRGRYFLVLASLPLERLSICGQIAWSAERPWPSSPFHAELERWLRSPAVLELMSCSMSLRSAE